MPKKRGGQWEAPRVILDAYHAKMTELQQQAAEETPAVSDERRFRASTDLLLPFSRAKLQRLYIPPA